MHRQARLLWMNFKLNHLAIVEGGHGAGACDGQLISAISGAMHQPSCLAAERQKGFGHWADQLCRKHAR